MVYPILLALLTPPPHLLFLANPNHVILLLLAGILLIYVEFHAPGAVLPGTLGLFLVLLACFGLSLLPVSAPAVAFALLGLGLLLLEFKLPTYGLLSVLGAIALIFALTHLIASPAQPVSAATAIAAGLPFAAITFLLGWSAVRARRNKILLGPQAMIGKLALARTALAPSGQVEIRGELWQATLTDPNAAVPTGHTVLILAAEGLHLTVQSAA